MISNKNISKQINFIPNFMIAERERVHRIIVIVVVTTLFTLISFGIYYFPEIKLVSLSSQLDSINTEMRYLEEASKLKTKYDDTKARLDKKKKIIEEIKSTELNVTFLMNKLIEASPKDVTLSYFSANSKDNIIANYIVNTPIEAANLVSSLKKLDIFESVELPNIPITDKKVDINFKFKLKPGIVLEDIKADLTASKGTKTNK